MRAWLISVAVLLAPATSQSFPTTGVFRFSIGSLEAMALKDGSLQVPNDGKSFIVAKEPSEVAAVLKSGGAPTDRFELSIQPLLVRSAGRVLLFDAGGGSSFGPTAGALPASMQAAGVSPAEVTDVFISHVHGDHVGGLVDSGALTFPHATIHMSAPEWKYLSEMDADTAKLVGIPHLSEFLKTLEPKVSPFVPNAEIISGVVRAVQIKGHTPGHSAYRIGPAGHTLLYIGDTLHSYVVSVREPQWLTSFDKEPAKAAASRVGLVARSASSGQRLYAVHFPFPGIGKIVKRDGSYRWVPEPPR